MPLIRLVADVVRSHQTTSHTVQDGVSLHRLPTAIRVEIEQEGDGFFLFRYDSNGQFAGDTWHQSVDEAKSQAKFEYVLADSGWRRLADDEACDQD